MQLYNEAKRQKQVITIHDVKSILSTLIPDVYPKIIISDDAQINRCDFLFSDVKVKKATRKIHFIKFPLNDKIKDEFSLFEGGYGKYGEKCIVEHDCIHEFLHLSGTAECSTDNINLHESFDFPLDALNDEILDVQRKYFLPKLTFSSKCERCHATGYIQCTSPGCYGKHEWQCSKCTGKGDIACSSCSGQGEKRCGNCSGQGKVKDYSTGKMIKCKECYGRGTKGCNTCNSTGRVRCNICHGERKIVCLTCYGDAQKKGLVDCPECKTIGVMAQIAYVETTIESDKITKISKDGSIGISKDHLLSHIKQKKEFFTPYINCNGKISDCTDEICGNVLSSLEQEIKVRRDGFPLVIKEDIFYQIIPVVEIPYKHLLTGEIHKLFLVDIWDNPEVVFDGDAEQIKKNFRSLYISVFSGVTRLFKTQGYKDKEDKLRHIRLLIHLAKADGIMDEKEKLFLSNEITSIKEFSNSEKKSLFALLNIPELPELTVNDVRFYNKENAMTCMEQLTKLAAADGEIDDSEESLIEKIRMLMREN